MPYGPDGQVVIELPEHRVAGVLTPPLLKPLPDPEGAVRAAMAAPIGAPTLDLLIASKGRPASQLKVAVVTSDATRPNVERWMLPPLIEALQRAGVSLEQITVVIGTGSHRPATPSEIEAMLGPQLNGRLRVVNHSVKESPLVDLGVSSHGFPIKANRLVAEADVKIVLGTVLPHPIAGYSGGGKGTTIGVGAAETIARTHVPEVLEHPRVALASTEGNPFFETLLEGARRLGVDWIINAVVDAQERLVDVAAGDVAAAHRALIARTAEPAFVVPFDEPAEVVVVSAGHPKDDNLYHVAAEAINVVAGEAALSPCVKPGGSIVVVSPMSEGPYNENFYNLLAAARDPAEVVAIVERNGITAPGQHRAVSLAKILLRHRVVVAQARLDPQVIRRAHMEWADDAQKAVEQELERHGPRAKALFVCHSHRLVPALRPRAKASAVGARSA